MYSTLDLCIISASNLSTVEDDTDVYVVAWLISGSEEPLAAQSTAFASATDSNPTWNFPVQFPVSDQIAPNNCPIVCLQLRCYHQGYLNYEEEIGEVYLRICDLLDSETPGSSQFVTYKIPHKFGAPIGELNLSYKFIGEDRHDWRMPTPSAPPLPFPPPPPDTPPSHPQERGRARGFPLKAAMAAAAALMAPQMADLLVKLQELMVAGIALALVFFVLVWFLILTPDLLRRLAANREGARR